MLSPKLKRFREQVVRALQNKCSLSKNLHYHSIQSYKIPQDITLNKQKYTKKNGLTVRCPPLPRANFEVQSESKLPSYRRLQRSNEELLGQAEGYQVQIEHLTSRLRSLPQNEILPFRRPSRLFPNHLPDPLINAEVDSRFSSSEESLPIFDEDDDEDDLDLNPVDEALVSHEIETDV